MQHCNRPSAQRSQPMRNQKLEAAVVGPSFVIHPLSASAKSMPVNREAPPPEVNLTYKLSMEPGHSAAEQIGIRIHNTGPVALICKWEKCDARPAWGMSASPRFEIIVVHSDKGIRALTSTRACS